MGKGSHRLFKAVVNEISQVLPTLGESGLEVSYFFPEPRNFAEVTRLSEGIKKYWLKETLKYINSLNNNQTPLFQETDKGDPVNPYGCLQSKNLV